MTGSSPTVREGFVTEPGSGSDRVKDSTLINPDALFEKAQNPPIES
jgi:hypothetical protein